MKKKPHLHIVDEQKHAYDLANPALVQQLRQELQEARDNYHRLLNQTMQALAKCLEEKDAYTLGHSTRVMEYALLIGRASRLNDKDIKNPRNRSRVSRPRQSGNCGLRLAQT